jgi:hypothetical protein
MNSPARQRATIADSIKCRHTTACTIKISAPIDVSAPRQ